MSTDLKELTTDLKARKLAKLAAENTALDGCMEDMSDVNFTIGKGYMSTAALPEAFITVGLIILRMAIRRSATGETVLPGTTWSVFHLLILVSLLMVAIVSIADKLKPYITVVKKKIYYGDKIWDHNEIQRVECTGFSTIKVYVNDKKQLSFSWEAENSEVFIAWVKKCGISFTDNRIGIRRSTSKTS